MKLSTTVDKLDRVMKDLYTKRDPKSEKKHQLDEINRKDKEIRKLQADLRDEREKANKNASRLSEEISVLICIIYKCSVTYHLQMLNIVTICNYYEH